MTHLPYIAASYGLFLAAAIAYSVAAATRLARASKRIAGLDPRAAR